MADRRGLERGRRDEREKACRVREHLRRRAQRLLDLVAHRAQVDAELVRPPFEPVHELLGVDPVSALRRSSPRGGVRMGQEAERLELRELAANGRRRDVEAGPLDEHARADRLARCDVFLDDTPQDLALSSSQLHLAPMVAADSAVTRPRRAPLPGGASSRASPCSSSRRASQSAKARSSAVTPPPRKRPRRVSRSSSPRPFLLSSTRSSATRRASAS